MIRKAVAFEASEARWWIIVALFSFNVLKIALTLGCKSNMTLMHESQIEQLYVMKAFLSIAIGFSITLLHGCWKVQRGCLVALATKRGMEIIKRTLRIIGRPKEAFIR